MTFARLLSVLLLGLFLPTFAASLRAQQCSHPYVAYYINQSGGYVDPNVTFTGENQVNGTFLVKGADFQCQNDDINNPTKYGTIYAEKKPSLVTGYGQEYGGHDILGVVVGRMLCRPTMKADYTTATVPTDYNRFYNRAYDAIYLTGSGTCRSDSGVGFRQDYFQCLGVACKPCNPKQSQCQGSPLLIDTTGDGFHLTSYDGGVKFDLAGTGQPQQMAWTAGGTNDAFLALPGADGLVHDGKHLFGNFTSQPASDHPNGFAALAVYDDPKNGGNGDGIIDSRDAVFESLRLWIDANHDGICQPSEMHTLPSLGVNSISLKYQEDDRTDRYRNQFRYRAHLNPDKPTDAGKTIYDVFFVTSDPVAANRLAKPEVASCANPRSVGILPTPNPAPLSK